MEREGERGGRGRGRATGEEEANRVFVKRSLAMGYEKALRIVVGNLVDWVEGYTD